MKKKLKKNTTGFPASIYLSAPRFSGDLLGSFGGQLRTGRGFSLWKSGCIPWVTSKANIFLYKLTLFVWLYIKGEFFPMSPIGDNTNRFEILAKKNVIKKSQFFKKCSANTSVFHSCGDLKGLHPASHSL